MEVHSSSKSRSSSRSNNSKQPSSQDKPSSSQTICQVPKLSTLCLITVAKKIERYHPSSFACLSEHDWEAIVSKKCQISRPKQQQQQQHQRKQPASSSSTSSATSASSNANAIPSLSHGRKTPAIMAKLLSDIEMSNELLQTSKIVDDLVWKDCVDFKFKRGGTSRPLVCFVPWNMLVSRIQQIGNELMEVTKPFVFVPPVVCTDNTVTGGSTSFYTLEKGGKELEMETDMEQSSEEQKEDNNGSSSGDTTILQQQQEEELSEGIKRAAKLEKIIRLLSGTPMNVPLLSETGIGKRVKAFIKECHKVVPKGKKVKKCSVPLYFPHVWKKRTMNIHQETGAGGAGGNPFQLKEITSNMICELESLLQGWKDMASASGVAMKGASSSSCSSSSTHKEAKEIQYQQDIDMVQKCNSWRQLYAALSRREEQIVKSRGAKIRKVREDLDKKRSKMGNVQTKKRMPRNSGLPGQSREAPKINKVQTLRQACKMSKVQVKGGNPFKTLTTKPSSAFGLSVASATKKTKPTIKSRTTSTNPLRGGRIERYGGIKRDIGLAGGKKMKLPSIKRKRT